MSTNKIKNIVRNILNEGRKEKHENVGLKIYKRYKEFLSYLNSLGLSKDEDYIALEKNLNDFENNLEQDVNDTQIHYTSYPEINISELRKNEFHLLDRYKDKINTEIVSKIWTENPISTQQSEDNKDIPITNGVNPNDLTAEFLRKRIPFLKEYEVEEMRGGYKFQKFNFRENVKLEWFDKEDGKKSIEFSNWNTFSYFTFFKDIEHNETTYNFILKNNSVLIPKQDKEKDVEKNIIERIIEIHVNNTLNKTSRSIKIIAGPNDYIPEDKLNRVFNEINKKMFEFDEIYSKVNLK